MTVDMVMDLGVKLGDGHFDKREAAPDKYVQIDEEKNMTMRLRSL